MSSAAPASGGPFLLWWVDAFTREPLNGNPCAVIVNAPGLDDAWMQRIAREMNLSETAFVFPSDVADFGVRYFTPTSEIPLAGHPTIATVHALREFEAIARTTPEVTLHMPAGIVPVTIEQAAGAYRYSMAQPPPVFGEVFDRAATARKLGLDEHDVYAHMMPQVVSTGTPQLHVPLASAEALARVTVDRHALFPATRTYFSVHVFARGNAPYALEARHFADFGDVKEDPFTGSATGGMAAYCARYGIVEVREYMVTQGAHVGRPGQAWVRVDGEPPGDIGHIHVAGEAVTVMRGGLAFDGRPPSIDREA